MKAVVCERTIALGRNRYRVDDNGSWTVLMWGWWPDSNELPSYRWRPIPEDSVPDEVLRVVRREAR